LLFIEYLLHTSDAESAGVCHRTKQCTLFYECVVFINGKLRNIGWTALVLVADREYSSNKQEPENYSDIIGVVSMVLDKRHSILIPVRVTQKLPIHYANKKQFASGGGIKKQQSSYAIDK
jgi:hypothetical protein